MFQFPLRGIVHPKEFLLLIGEQQEECFNSLYAGSSIQSLVASEETPGCTDVSIPSTRDRPSKVSI